MRGCERLSAAISYFLLFATHCLLWACSDSTFSFIRKTPLFCCLHQWTSLGSWILVGPYPRSLSRNQACLPVLSFLLLRYFANAFLWLFSFSWIVWCCRLAGSFSVKIYIRNQTSTYIELLFESFLWLVLQSLFKALFIVFGFSFFRDHDESHKFLFLLHKLML